MTVFTLHDSAGHELNDQWLAIEMGAIPGVSRMTKFGTNELVGTDVEFIWEAGNGWTKLAAATLLEVASSSTDDVMTTGSGAWAVLIEGLDADYAVQSEVVPLNGQTVVLTTKEYLYINRMYIAVSGSDEVNQGNVWIADDLATWSAGVPQEQNYIQGSIHLEHGQTQQCIYTVPLGFTAFVTGGYIITSANQDTEFHVMTYDRATNTRRIALEGTISNSAFTKDNKPYIGVENKTTVWVEAANASSPSAVSAGLDMILVDNKYQR